MSELSVDVTVANRFISSLSKSLQALCHGCMDFDSGIEIVGYININIDSGSKVDYVLNEKVLKSSTTNAMTFVSNSFLAKKEQLRQTREGACSPIPELQPQPPSISHQHWNQHSNFHHRSAFSQSSHSHVLGGAQKRAWGGMDRVSPKKYSRSTRASFPQSSAQMQSSQSFGATTSDTSFVKPDVPFTSADSDLGNANIKKEYMDNEGNFSGQNENIGKSNESANNETMGSRLLESSMNIKSDPDALPETEAAAQSSNQNIKETSPQDPSDDVQKKGANEISQNTSHSESEFSMFGMSVPESSAADSHQTLSHGNTKEKSQVNENAETSEYEEARDDMSFSHSSFADHGETSGDGSQFDVIEIGDEDEDVQAMFSDSHLNRPYEPHSNANIYASSRIGGQNSGCHIDEQMQDTRRHVFNTSGSGVQCLKCSLFFENYSMLRAHMSTCHENEMPYTCSYCGKGYLTSTGLNLHVQIHIKGKAYRCPICDAKFTQKGTVKKHLNSKHQSSQCPKCNIVLRLGDEYNQHLLHMTCEK